MVLANWMINAVLILAAFSSIAVGFLVLTRNKFTALNQRFVYLCLSVAVWVASNFLYRTVPYGAKLEIALISYAAAGALAIAFYYFCLQLAHRTSTAWSNWIVIFAILTSIMALIPGLVAYKITNDGVILTHAPILMIYGTPLITLLVLGIVKIVRYRSRTVAQEKKRLSFILFGLVLSGIGAIIFNFFIPLVLGSYQFVAIGPACALFFLTATAYSIAKHGLFDIRFFVVRAVAYSFTTLLLCIMYILPVLALVQLLIFRHSVLSLNFGGAVLLVSILAFFYERIRRRFDAASNKIFLRDSYNTERLIGEINKVLVASIDLNLMLKSVAAVIERNLKVDYCAFALKETSVNPLRIISIVNHRFDLGDAPTMRRATIKAEGRIIIADFLGDSQVVLANAMSNNNIAALARLAPDNRIHQEGLGYILLGAKRNGELFNRQDIQSLETMIDGLIVAIQNAMRFEEIENFNYTLQAKVNEATHKLRRSNDKLKELDETKDDFISMASHQLRTPLTSVKGYLSMVIEGDAGKINKTQKEMLGQAFFSSQRMVYLIADLLNVSRLKTGKFIIERTPTKLDVIVRQELEQLEETAASRSLKLSYEAPEDFPVTMLDETKIRQVIMNFIDNAIYYTPAGGQITVRLLELNHSIELRIEDNGIGVPKQDQPHLFTKFYRGGNARQARPDGTGLGLFMAKKVIIAQGGSLIFDSQEGKGSTFGFIFSKAQVAATAVTRVNPTSSNKN